MEKELLLLKSTVPPVSNTWNPEQRVEYLVEHFRDRLRNARETERTEDGELPEIMADPGAYFVIRGRNKALDGLTRAGGSIYQAFTSSIPEDLYKRGVFFHMAVAYPGAGKSTIGIDFPRLFRDLWVKQGPRRDRILAQAFQGAAEGLESEYKTMVEATLAFPFELCMYHNLVTTNTGGLLPEEEGIGAAQVLALRALHGALSSPQAPWAYKDLLVDLPQAMRKLTLDDVVTFIRNVFGVPDETKILLSWYFDELNSAATTATGQRVQEGMATWAQDMLAEYVDWAYRNRRGKTFVVVGGATTRFSACRMSYTKSGRAKAHYIEFRPLTPDEAKEVLEVFCSRLFNRPRQVCPAWLNLLVEMSGGFPRMIQMLIRALLTVSATVDLSRSKLVERLSREMTKRDVEEVLANWIALLGAMDYFTDYTSLQKLPILMGAFRASVLGSRVTRLTRVLPPTFSHLDDKYDNLEAQGVVALSSADGGDEQVDTQAYSTFGERSELVRFPPLLFFYLMRKDSVQPGLAVAFSSDWREKEVADIVMLRLNIWLHWLTSAPNPAPVSEVEFYLTDIMPKDYWSIPRALAAQKFKLVAGITELRRMKSRSALDKCLWENSDCSFFLGSRNSGTDGLCVLKETGTQQQKLLFLESKMVTDALCPPRKAYKHIRAEAVKCLKLLVDFGDPTAEAGRKKQVEMPRRKKQKYWYDEPDIKKLLGLDEESGDGDESEDGDEDYCPGEDEESDGDSGENDIYSIIDNFNINSSCSSSSDKWLSLSRISWVYMTDQQVLNNTRELHQASEDDLDKAIIIGATHPSGTLWNISARIVSVMRVKPFT